MEEEYKEFNSLKDVVEDELLQRRTATLINLLRLKLKSRDETALWYLNMGIAKAGLGFYVKNGEEGKSLFNSYLKDIALLAEKIPLELPENRKNKLIEIAKYANQKHISKEKMAEIIRDLTETRNISITGNN